MITFSEFRLSDNIFGKPTLFPLSTDTDWKNIMQTLEHKAAIAMTPGQAKTVVKKTVGVGTMPQGALKCSNGSAIARIIDEKMDTGEFPRPNSGAKTLITLASSSELDLHIVNVLEVARAHASAMPPG